MVATVTFESVTAAIGVIEAAGQKPSVRKIMDQLLLMTGVKGSPNVVTKLFNDYKSGRPLVRLADVGLDAGIAQAIAAQMQRIAEQSAAAAEDRAAELEDNIAVLMESQSDTEKQIETLSADLFNVQAQAAGFIEQLKEAGAEAARNADLHAHEASDLRQELARERMRADKVTSDLARAEVRLEALPGLHGDLEKTRAALAEQAAARVAAEQSAAVLEAKLEAAERFALEARDQAKQAIERAEKTAAQAAQTTQELNILKLQIQAQQSALDTAAREIESAKNAAREARESTKKSGEESAGLRGQLEAKKEAFSEAKRVVSDAAETPKKDAKKVS